MCFPHAANGTRLKESALVPMGNIYEQQQQKT